MNELGLENLKRNHYEIDDNLYTIITFINNWKTKHRIKKIFSGNKRNYVSGILFFICMYKYYFGVRYLDKKKNKIVSVTSRIMFLAKKDYFFIFFIFSVLTKQSKNTQNLVLYLCIYCYLDISEIMELS